MYTWFSEKESYKLQPDLMNRLDWARDIAEVPFIITSGFRTPEDNERVGGVENSAHLTGWAVDIAYETEYELYRILYALLRQSFTRIGIYEGHVHVDMDPSKNEERVWR